MSTTKEIQVKVYSTESCPYCIALEDWLNENKVEYSKHQPSDLPGGTDVVPVTLIGEDRFIGFDRAGITKALKQHDLL